MELGLGLLNKGNDITKDNESVVGASDGLCNPFSGRFSTSQQSAIALATLIKISPHL